MKKFFYLGLLFTFLGFSLWVFFFSYFTQIKKIELLGDFPQKKELNIFLENFLAEDRLPFPLDRNFFFFSGKKMEEKIIEAFPLIQAVITEKKFPDQVSMKVQAREGVFVWCFGEKCFWIDRNGQVFFGPQDKSSAEKTPYVVVLGGEDGEKQLGEYIFSAEKARFVLALEETLKKDDDFKIDRFFSSPDIASDELRASFSEGWSAYFSFKSPVVLQITTLKKLLEEKLKDVSRDKIEYIDLRLSGKVLYKLKSNPSDLKPEEESGQEDKDN